jgi:hypothetical protein
MCHAMGKRIGLAGASARDDQEGRRFQTWLNPTSAEISSVKRKRLSRADRSVPLDPFRAGAAHVMQLRPVTRRDEPAHNSPNKR